MREVKLKKPLKKPEGLSYTWAAKTSKHTASQTGQLTGRRHLFLTALEAASLRRGRQHGRVRTLLLICRGLTILSHCIRLTKYMILRKNSNEPFGQPN